MVSQGQLYELGLTYEQIRRMVRDAHLLRLHHNVYAVGHGGIVPKAHLLAAQLSIGDRCFLSHRSAAAIHGLRPVNTHDIEVTVVGGGARGRRGLTVHRTRSEPHPKDVVTSGMFRVSSVLRMLCESAARESVDELDKLVTAGVRKRLLRPDAADGRAAIQEALARHRMMHGIDKLQAVFAHCTRVTDGKSDLERDFDAWLLTHPEIPPPEPNVYIDHWEIDRYWPQHQVAVELDGRPYHIAVRDMEKDRIKDAALLRLGITPLRCTDLRFNTDQAGILSDLHHFLGIGSAGNRHQGGAG